MKKRRDGPYRTAAPPRHVHVHDWRFTMLYGGTGDGGMLDHRWYCCECGEVAGFVMHWYLNIKHTV